MISSGDMRKRVNLGKIDVGLQNLLVAIDSPNGGIRWKEAKSLAEFADYSDDTDLVRSARYFGLYLNNPAFGNDDTRRSDNSDDVRVDARNGLSCDRFLYAVAAETCSAGIGPTPGTLDGVVAGVSNCTAGCAWDQRREVGAASFLPNWAE